MYGKILIAAAGLSVWIFAYAYAYADSDLGVNFNSAGNPAYGTPGLMDFTSPSAPTYVPPGTTLLSPSQPALMGSDISLSPTLLDNGTGGPGAAPDVLRSGLPAYNFPVAPATPPPYAATPGEWANPGGKATPDRKNSQDE